MHRKSFFGPAGLTLIAMVLGACTNEFDRIYDDSLHLSQEVGVQKLDRFRQWHERWRRGEFGPTAPEPRHPVLLYTREMAVMRMRFMEHELLYLLQQRCPAGQFKCRIDVLRDLGFACGSGAPATCTLHNNAYSPHYSLTIGRYEHHFWSVVIESDTPNAAVSTNVSTADAIR